MADSESRKVIGNLWASGATADRQDPEDVGITRTAGFNLPYEQIGSGSEPERTVFNQLFRELHGWMEENIRTGGVKPYDALIDYYQYARVAVGASKYVALVANGPALGNTVSPTASGQQVWRIY